VRVGPGFVFFVSFNQFDGETTKTRTSALIVSKNSSDGCTCVDKSERGA